jgi:hypothetical protein
MNIKSSLTSSISSFDSQNHSIPYSTSVVSSYTSSFENSYRSNPNGVYSPRSVYTENNSVHIPIPSIDNIKQLHGLLLDRIQFWKNCVPINIDIFAGSGSNENTGYNYRRKSYDFGNGNEVDDGIYEHKNDFSNNSLTLTRTRSSSISNIYPVKASTSFNPVSTKFNNKRLLERWVVSYEPNNKESSNKSRNSKVDTTDLILLVQSLYSYIRLMPLHSLLSDKSIKKNDLQYCISTADGFLLLPLFEGDNNDVDFCDVGSSGFDLSAKLKVYKFTKASTTLGNLHISVVYDANINNSNSSTNISHSISKSLSSTSSFHFNDANNNPTTAGVANKTAKNINNTNNSSSSISLNQPKDNLLIVEQTKDSTSSTSNIEEEPLKDKSNSDTPADDKASSSNTNRKTVKTIGSPFPSPKTRTKVLSLTQNKYSFQPQKSQLSSSSSNLILQLMNKQHLEKYSSSVHSLSDNNSLSSHSNLLLSGFNYKKSSTNNSNITNSTTKTHQLNSINIPKNSNLLLNCKDNDNPKYLSAPNSLSLNSNKNNNVDSQNNSIELFGSLVGSYEESILSGRMSTLPSKPIKFISEIGVIGFGKCHPRLKCPQHINIIFPVYFYEIPDKNDFFTTPYVGTVDIEQYFQKQNELKKQKQEQQQKMEQQHKAIEKLDIKETLEPENNIDTLETSKIKVEELNNKTKTLTTSIPSAILLNDKPIIKRNSSSNSLNGLSTKFPGYRIPFKGQIQVIIKNPSKTAVKVFLIPYDFHDMPPGTKTFIRQKSYLKNTINSRNPLDQKCSLRYAIHLQFISPSKKKLYLYKSLRVVFAHKAPEKDEKLYTISDGPIDPKYISIVDNNNSNYNHHSNELNNDKFFGSGHSLKTDGKGLSSKEENEFYSSSYSLRRRSSFGSNIMMLAEMGVNLGDYSVSPVKPIVHQYPYSFQQQQYRGIGGINTKITKPLYYRGSSYTNVNNISQQSDLPSSSKSSFSKYLSPNYNRYPSQNVKDDMTLKLPSKVNEKMKCSAFDVSTNSYSSEGLTTSITDSNNELYSKSSQHSSESTNLNNKDNLESKSKEPYSSSISTNFKVFNYIN